MKRLVCTLIFLNVLLSLDAATYFIDYTAGNDANNGTTKSSPWKRAPGMKGFAGNYSHVAGDRLIFKGGVTWPTDCYQWKVTWSGSPTVSDYYGADTNWFVGASFKRPLFDFERRPINGWEYGAGLFFQNVKNVIIDNLEFANHATPLAKDGIGTWLCATITVFPGENITLQNCVVRDWWQPNYKESTTNGVVTRIESGTSGGGAFHGHYASNLRAVNCEFHQLGSETINGNSVWNITHVENCHFHHTATAVMSAATVRNNYIHHLTEPSDPAAHSNVMLCYGGTQATGNVIHDICARAQVIFLAPGHAGPGQALCQSNTVFNVAQPCIAIDTDGQNDQGAGIKVLSNTLVGSGGSGMCVRVGERKNGPLNSLELRNNRFITSGKPVLMNDPQAGGGMVTTFSASDNITNTLTQAMAAGLSPINWFGAKDQAPPVIEPTDPPVEPPPVIPPAVTNIVTVTNWVTATNLLYTYQTNWITEHVTLTNCVTATNYVTVTNLPLDSSRVLLFEGKIILTPTP